MFYSKPSPLCIKFLTTVFCIQNFIFHYQEMNLSHFFRLVLLLLIFFPQSKFVRKYKNTKKKNTSQTNKSQEGSSRTMILFTEHICTILPGIPWDNPPHVSLSPVFVHPHFRNDDSTHVGKTCWQTDQENLGVSRSKGEK